METIDRGHISGRWDHRSRLPSWAMVGATWGAIACAGCHAPVLDSQPDRSSAPGKGETEESAPTFAFLPVGDAAELLSGTEPAQGELIISMWTDQGPPLRSAFQCTVDQLAACLADIPEICRREPSPCVGEIALPAGANEGPGQSARVEFRATLRSGEVALAGITPFIRLAISTRQQRFVLTLLGRSLATGIMGSACLGGGGVCAPPGDGEPAENPTAALEAAAQELGASLQDLLKWLGDYVDGWKIALGTWSAPTIRRLVRLWQELSKSRIEREYGSPCDAIFDGTGGEGVVHRKPLVGGGLKSPSTRPVHHVWICYQENPVRQLAVLPAVTVDARWKAQGFEREFDVEIHLVTDPPGLSQTRWLELQVVRFERTLFDGYVGILDRVVMADTDLVEGYSTSDDILYSPAFQTVWIGMENAETLAFTATAMETIRPLDRRVFMDRALSDPKRGLVTRLQSKSEVWGRYGIDVSEIWPD